MSSERIVFFEKPQTLFVDQVYSTKSPDYRTVDKLKNYLKENGPFVVAGKIGPPTYTGTPFEFKERVGNEDVYIWKPHRTSAFTQIILIGMKETESDTFLYYTLARDATNSEISFIRKYTPSKADTNIYVIPYEDFFNRVENLFPVVSECSWLFSVPVNQILEGGEIEKRCKQIGQQIFDRYKKEANGNSIAGKDALLRIYEATKFLTKDGGVRKAWLGCVWDQIGDEKWRWRTKNIPAC